MDIELVKASLLRLRERRAAIPAMRDYKPQKSGGAKKAGTTAPVALDLGALFGKLNKLSSEPPTEEKKGGE
jgi:hypothetical protein